MAHPRHDAIIVSFGQLKAQRTLAEITKGITGVVMRARTPEADRLAGVLTQAGIAFRRLGPDEIAMDGVTPEQVGPLLASNQIVLYELAQEGGDLDDGSATDIHTGRCATATATDRRAVINSLRAELLKMRTMPGVWVTFG